MSPAIPQPNSCSPKVENTAVEKASTPTQQQGQSSEPVALVLLSLLLTVLSFPFAFYGDTKFLLEHSWMTALNEAYENGSVFGKDFVFTWGPLGFLGTRIGVHLNKAHLVIGDILLFGSTFYLLYTFFLRQRGWLFPMAAAVLAMRMSNYSVTAFTLFIILSMIIQTTKNIPKSTYVLSAVLGALILHKGKLQPCRISFYSNKHWHYCKK